MTANVFRFINEPIRKSLTWDDLWKGPDGGLVACWERGRAKAIESAELSQACIAGELPVLAWKGGIDKKIKGKKYGSLFYLATWQGLRGENLNINPHQDISIICSRTNVEVIFTNNLLDYETLKLEEPES